jgi:hypothetical protein
MQTVGGLAAQKPTISAALSLSAALSPLVSNEVSASYAMALFCSDGVSGLEVGSRDSDSESWPLGTVVQWRWFRGNPRPATAAINITVPNYFCRQ